MTVSDAAGAAARWRSSLPAAKLGAPAFRLGRSVWRWAAPSLAHSGMIKPRILVVDDEAAMREVLDLRLSQWGYDVALASSAEEARQQLAAVEPWAVLCDVVLPDTSGLDLVRELVGDEGRPVLLMTAYGNIDRAVEAMKQGARDFLTKPLDYTKLESTLAALKDELALADSAESLEATLDRGAGLGLLVGLSKPMRQLYKLLKTLAGSDTAAILTGESGTGKELAARTLHDLSARAQGPFVAVNSAAIPEGLIESEIFGHEKGAFTGATGLRQGCFELADRGTLFLDEIGEMPLVLQPKLLRILEGGRVRRLGGSAEIRFNVRVLAATNRDPEEAVAQGTLRSDLFYRLNVFTVVMPPLRDRTEDLPLLAQHFIRAANRKHGTEVTMPSRETLELLSAYPWPGNVRELRNVVERGVILAGKGRLESTHLPPYVRRLRTGPTAEVVLPAGVTAAEAERLLILSTLDRVGQNKAEAARQLGLDVKTIRNKLASWGLPQDRR